jgi:hypothetical protein
MFSFINGDVSWNNKKQLIVVVSRTKVEHKGATIVTCEVVWLQKLLLDLG